MEIKNVNVYNFENAFRGMRNPMNSWNKGDSYFGLQDVGYGEQYVENVAISWAESNNENISESIDSYKEWLYNNGILRIDYDYDVADVAYIGPTDMDLAKRLIAAGPEHRKFLRQIFVSMDIDAPFYWWKEFDTYKIATVADSCSTMHKLTSKPITLDSFELDDYQNIPYPKDKQEEGIKSYCDDDFIEMCLVPYLEYLRQQYLETKDVKYWKELVRWMPNGYLQMRTWTGNYETLRAMYHQRKNHKLTEWHYFCDVIETLPYAKELIID